MTEDTAVVVAVKVSVRDYVTDFIEGIVPRSTAAGA